MPISRTIFFSLVIPDIFKDFLNISDEWKSLKLRLELFFKIFFHIESKTSGVRKFQKISYFQDSCLVYVTALRRSRFGKGKKPMCAQFWIILRLYSGRPYRDFFGVFCEKIFCYIIEENETWNTRKSAIGNLFMPVFLHSF